jgi:hypothetical protein
LNRVAEGAVMFHIRRHPAFISFDVWASVEIWPVRRKSEFIRCVRECPPDRMGDGEDPATTRSKDPIDLGKESIDVRDEGHGSVGGKCDVEGRGRERKGGCVCLNQWERGIVAPGVQEHPKAEIEGHDPCSLPRDPAGALRPTCTDF